MIRVAYDVRCTMGNKSGIGVYAAQLLEAMRALNPPDIELVPIHGGGGAKMRTPERFAWDQLGVAREAKKAGAHVLHQTGFSASALAAMPVVLTVHDLIGALFPGNFSWSARLYWARWLPFSVRFASAVLADSEATRDDILKLTPVPAERIRVVPLAVSPQFSREGETDAVLARLGIRRPYVLGVSSVEPRKNFPMLVEAFGLLKERAGDLRLVIAGSKDWDMSAVEAARRHAGLQESVHLTGYVADTDLPALYRGAELFVFPSSYEGFGLPVLEAMACGTPVLTSRVSSIPEVTGQSALLVDPPLTAEKFAGAMAALLADDALRRRYAEAGPARAAAFSWEKTARETLDAYRRVAR